MYFPKPAVNENDLAIIERGDTASHSIEAGQYVSWKGKLGKAVSAILQGASLDDSLFDYDADGVINNLGINFEYISSRSGTGDITVSNMSDYKLFLCAGVGYAWLGSILIPNDSRFNSSNQYCCVVQTAANYLFYIKKKDDTTITFTLQSNVSSVYLYGIK